MTTTYFFVFVVGILLSAMGDFFDESSTFSTFWMIISLIFSLWLSLGVIRVYLDVLHGSDIAFEKIFSQGGLLLATLGAAFLYALMVGVGFLLLIIPGVYLLIRFFYFEIFIVDKQLGSINSLKNSWRLTTGNWWSIFGLAILLLLFNVAGALALVLGLLVTMPVSLMVTVCAYEFLSGTEGPRSGAVNDNLDKVNKGMDQGGSLSNITDSANIIEQR